MTTKNKPGRKGVKRRKPSGMFRGGPVLESKRKEDIDTTRPEYVTGYERGWKAGYLTGETEAEEFLEALLTKRNVKDVKGLIEKRLLRG